MSVRSLNKVTLIGNLTRDPELRYTPAGTAVCTFGVATNRQWTTQTGETKEETEFHRIVSWNKLAELCSQLLSKGRKVYVEGRLATHTWTGQDGNQRTTTEIVIDDMIILDSRRYIKEGAGGSYSQPVKQAKDKTAEEAGEGETGMTEEVSEEEPSEEKSETDKKKKSGKEGSSGKKKTKSSKTSKKKEEEKEGQEENLSEEITPDDIPF